MWGQDWPPLVCVKPWPDCRRPACPGGNDLPCQEGGLTGGRGGRQHAGAGPAVYRDFRGVSDDEVVIAILLHEGGDTVEGEVPRDLLEMVAAGARYCAYFSRVGAWTISRRALRAERAAVH